jgi:hypothetical protein
MPHQENEHQWSVKEFWHFIIGNQMEMCWLLLIYDVLTAYLHSNASELLVGALQRKSVVSVWEAVAGMSLSYQPREPANLSSMEVLDQTPLRLPTMRDLQWLKPRSH